MKFLVLILAVFSCMNIHAQGLSAAYLRLNPSSLPTICRLGDLRTNTSSGRLSMCGASNNWGDFGTVPGGGTGGTSFTAHGVLLGQGTSPLTATAAGTTGYLLTSGGSSADPTWQTLNLATSPALSGALGVANGGTGQTSLPLLVPIGGTGTTTTTAFGLVTGGTTATGAFQNAGAGLAGTILKSNGAAALPTWTATPTLGVAGTTLGTLSFSGNTSGTIVIAPQAAAGSYNFNLPVTAGSAGSVLTSQGGLSAAMTWTTPLTNPMTTVGDVIVGGAAGAANRLPVGSDGQILQADSSQSLGLSYQNSLNFQNFLVNGAFDYWQAGTTTTVTATGGATPANTYSYLADQWYVNNILGGGTIEGVITYSQQTAFFDGDQFAAKVQITTAPTGTGIQNGVQLWQVLSNKASLPLYNKTASFQIQVKAFGNVNQVGLQFFYATTEAKPNNAIGSEVTCAVTSASYTTCKISGQALGTAQTTAGVIGIRIRPTTVSTGNLYDLNNGFQVEQAMLNLGNVPSPFLRQFSNPTLELAACQFFYEKSYDANVAPGTVNSTGSVDWQTRTALTASTPGTLYPPPPQFKVTKRTQPTVTLWDPTGNNANAVRNVTTGNSRSGCTAGNAGTNGFFIVTVDGTSAVSVALDAEIRFQWVADARI